jgi:pyrrolidone-carboxylate peptidase
MVALNGTFFRTLWPYRKGTTFVKLLPRLRTRALALGGAVIITMVGLSSASAQPPAPECFDPDLPITVEESRLTVPTAPGEEPASQQLLEAGGFTDFAERFEQRLCSAPNLKTATKLAEQHGAMLWRTAVDRAQGQRPELGTIDEYDDRPLYWAHMEATSALRQWAPQFFVDEQERAALVEAFVDHARGIESTDFPSGKDVTRVLVSGFDPYQLQNEPRRSNPSGVIALQLDGQRIRTPDGVIAVEALTLPVTWSGFDAGIVEDAFGPHLLEDAKERADLVMTISQGGSFNIEQWAGRWRGGSPDNNNEGQAEPIPEAGGHWPMPEVMEFIETTLPHEAMVAADSEPFSVQLNPRICEWPPEGTPADRVCHTNGPTEGWRAFSGGGGNYLSNESMYRSNRLRLGLDATDVPGGHLHTPAQTYPSDPTVLLDVATEQRRHDIADQAVALVTAAAKAVQ